MGFSSFFGGGVVNLFPVQKPDFLFTVSTVEIFVKRDTVGSNGVISAFILVGGLQRFSETSLDPSYYHFPTV